MNSKQPKYDHPFQAVGSMRALVLVDIQKDFMSSGRVPIPDSDRIIPVVNRIQPEFKLVVAAVDWHPRNHQSFKPPVDESPTPSDHHPGNHRKPCPVHCVMGSEGAQLPESLDRGGIMRVFAKGTDTDVNGYSAFFDAAAQNATGLEEFLKQRGILQVFIAGLPLESSVRHTAMDAFKLGFKTYVVLDATSGFSLYRHEIRKVNDEMRRAGIHIIHSTEIPFLE